jgi:hypothetical protein
MKMPGGWRMACSNSGCSKSLMSAALLRLPAPGGAQSA